MMSILSGLLLLTFLSGAVGTGAGGVMGTLMKKTSGKGMQLLLSFASGVMIALVCFDLLQDAAETGTAPGWIALMILLGTLAVQMLEEVIDRKTEACIEIISRKLLAAGIVMVFAIAFHNVPIGMSLGAASVHAGTALGKTTVAMALLIGIHNIPEGMAIAAPLAASGLSKGKAVLLTACGGLTIMFGAVIGYFIGDLGEMWLAFSLSFASGAMLYVVFGEILPHVMREGQSKLATYFIAAGITAGLLLTLL